MSCIIQSHDSPSNGFLGNLTPDISSISIFSYLFALDKYKLVAYSYSMDIEYDWAKNKANKATHKLDMELAILLFEESHTVIIDGRADYGEIRKIAYGYINGRECICVFTEREKALRVISLRKANRREANDHY